MTSPVSFEIIRTATSRTDGSLVHGNHVRAVVVRQSGSNGFVLRIGGNLYHTRSEIAIKPGMVLQLRIARSGDTIRLIQERAITRVVDQTHTTSDNPARNSAITALFRSGMPILPESLRAVTRLLERYKRTDGFLARLAAMVVDKGITPPDACVDEILIACEARDDSGQPGSEEHTERGNGREQDAEDIPDIDEDELIRALKAQFGSERGESGLQLFNHLTAAHDDWKIIPFGVSYDTWNVSGTIRLRSGPNGADSMVVEVRDGDGSYFVRINRTAGRRTAVIPRRTYAEAGAWDKLCEKLRNIGIEIDDSKKDETFDGFSDERLESQGSIDAIV